MTPGLSGFTIAVLWALIVRTVAITAGGAALQAFFSGSGALFRRLLPPWTRPSGAERRNQGLCGPRPTDTRDAFDASDD